MTRFARSPFAALVAVVGSLGVSGPSHAECPAVEDMERTIPTVVPVRVHEWGVWRMDANGHVQSIDDLARETPTFVHRSTSAPRVELGPSYELVPCEKPVVYFHADQPIDLVVTVGFASGTPWLYYPDAELGLANGIPSVRWRLHLDAESAPAPELVDVPVVHWWTNLRAPRASTITTSSGTGERERFAFYDGATRIEPFYRAARRGIETIPGRRPALASWTTDGHVAAQLDIHGRRTSETRLADVAAMRTALRTILVARGLYADEAESMLTTWNAELFRGSGRRIVYVLQDDAYASMLPLTISPMPMEIKRVGVVIQRL